MSIKYISVLLLISLLFIGQTSAGTPYYVNGTTYPMIWNGTYASENINYMTYWSTGYDLFWNGGLLQTVWDGLYAYDMIAYPNNGTAISPWAMWHVESYNPTNKKWGKTIPVSNQFIKIDNSTLKRVMTMGSGEAFNITYHNYGTRIKQDLELSNVLARQYRLTYRIDSVAAQDVNIDTKKFTPGFFNNFTLFDVTDVLPYTVNAITGTYLYGWNTSASIDNTNRKMYFTLTNGQVMATGQTVFIDPSWSTNGSTTPAWINSSRVNTTLNRDTTNIELRQQVDDYISYWRFDGSSGTVAYDENQTSQNNGTLVNMNIGLNNCTGNCSGWNSSGKFGNAIAFDGVNDYVNAGDKAVFAISNYTWSMWIKGNSAPGTTTVIQPLWNANEQFQFSWSHTGVGFNQSAAHKSGATWYKSQIVSVLSANTWYYISATYNGRRGQKRVTVNSSNFGEDVGTIKLQAHWGCVS